jgi:hypothetical protein
MLQRRHLVIGHVPGREAGIQNQFSYDKPSSRSIFTDNFL